MTICSHFTFACASTHICWLILPNFSLPAAEERETAAAEEYNFDGRDFTAQDLETARTTIMVKIE